MNGKNVMKHISLFCLLLCSKVVAYDGKSQIVAGEWINRVREGNRIDQKTINFYTEKRPYAKGGITFMYPEDYFTINPCIFVTIELHKLAYETSLIVSPLVIKNSADSVVIRVNKIVTGFLKNSIQEADTNDVLVQIFVFGP